MSNAMHAKMATMVLIAASMFLALFLNYCRLVLSDAAKWIVIRVYNQTGDLLISEVIYLINQIFAF